MIVERIERTLERNIVKGVGTWNRIERIEAEAVLGIFKFKLSNRQVKLAQLETRSWELK